MTREEVENGKDYMLIDGEDNAVPDGFNADYLKAYYGKPSFSSILTCLFLHIYESGILTL